MCKTNLEKFEEIKNMMELFNELAGDYLNTLNLRYEYMGSYRSEYTKLVRTISDLKDSLKTKADNEEEIKGTIDSVKKHCRKKIEAYTEKEEQEAYINYQKEIAALENVLNTLGKLNNKQFVEENISELESLNIEIKEMYDLLELVNVNSEENREKIKSIVMIINAAEEDYLSSFKAYRQACENKEEVFEAFDDIFSLLIDLQYEEEATILAKGLPDLEEERKERPDPQKLLEVLRPVKSAGLEYWQSNRTNAFAYDYNIAFANEVKYTRRALLEDREYIGTRNAFDRLNTAYEMLYDYMYEKYHQLQGTPYNYHGHLGRK